LDFCGFLGFLKNLKNLGFLKATSTALMVIVTPSKNVLTYLFIPVIEFHIIVIFSCIGSWLVLVPVSTLNVLENIIKYII